MLFDKKPKLYDKDGNEVQGPPQDGVVYYDKDGNELKMPSKGKPGPGGPGGFGGPGHGHPNGQPPKLYDKDS